MLLIQTFGIPLAYGKKEYLPSLVQTVSDEHRNVCPTLCGDFASIEEAFAVGFDSAAAAPLLTTPVKIHNYSRDPVNTLPSVLDIRVNREKGGYDLEFGNNSWKAARFGTLEYLREARRTLPDIQRRIESVLA